jgi:hypothetical protein
VEHLSAAYQDVLLQVIHFLTLVNVVPIFVDRTAVDTCQVHLHEEVVHVVFSVVHFIHVLSRIVVELPQLARNYIANVNANFKSL